MKTARFWIFYNDGFIRLSLKPGQTLSFGKRYGTDEGWHSESESFEHCGEYVALHWGSDGVDCDGRLSRGGELHCPLNQLAARYVEDGPRGYDLPEWEKVEESQRDYSAEAAGY
jgi:hypothetical protein